MCTILSFKDFLFLHLILIVSLQIVLFCIMDFILSRRDFDTEILRFRNSNCELKRKHRGFSRG